MTGEERRLTLVEHLPWAKMDIHHFLLPVGAGYSVPTGQAAGLVGRGPGKGPQGDSQSVCSTQVLSSALVLAAKTPMRAGRCVCVCVCASVHVHACMCEHVCILLHLKLWKGRSRTQCGWLMLYSGLPRLRSWDRRAHRVPLPCGHL